LHVEFFASGKTIESPGHKMSPVVFLEQSAFADINPAVLRHAVIGIFDDAVAPRVFELLVPVTLDPSNLSNQYSKPSPAGIWPERTSLVEPGRTKPTH
jgi:hypothetical protein